MKNLEKLSCTMAGLRTGFMGGTKKKIIQKKRASMYHGGSSDWVHGWNQKDTHIWLVCVNEDIISKAQMVD
jgi:hypothetical protein